MNAQQEHKNIPATSGDLGRTSMKRAVIRVEPVSTYLLPGKLEGTYR